MSLGLFLLQVNRLKLSLVKELVSLENEIEQIKFPENIARQFRKSDFSQRYLFGNLRQKKCLLPIYWL